MTSCTPVCLRIYCRAFHSRFYNSLHCLRWPLVARCVRAGVSLAVGAAGLRMMVHCLGTPDLGSVLSSRLLSFQEGCPFIRVSITQF